MIHLQKPLNDFSKGNIQAIPLILIAVTTLTIAVLTSQLVLNNIQSATDNSEINQEALKDADKALQVFDYGVVFVNASFYLISFILVYKIPANPIFAIPAVLSLGLSVWLSSVFANVYSLFANTGPFTSVANNFPAINTLFNNYALITALLGGLMIVLLYGKTRTGQEVAA